MSCLRFFLFVLSIVYVNCAVHNVVLVRDGQNDGKEFTDDGAKELLLTAQRLRELDLELTAIYSSKYTRAIESAKIIGKQLCKNCKYVKDTLLNECCPNSRSGQRHVENAHDKYLTTPDSSDEDRTTPIVAHNNILRALIAR